VRIKEHGDNWVGVDRTCEICGTIYVLERGDKPDIRKDGLYYNCPVCGFTMLLQAKPSRWLQAKAASEEAEA
jgi:DNA-directed RNA polymerase subunit RPC12/RpoP